MIGSAILRHLKKDGFNNLVTRTSAELDLLNQQDVNEFCVSENPAYVFLTSVRVGGILANSQYPAEFIYENLMSEANVIHAAWKSGVKKLLFLGSSCIYPKDCPQPMKEEHLLTGKLEPTSEPYAIAKIAGIRMCQSYSRQYRTMFISAVPADAYGPGDNFNPETGHVLAALMSKLHRAKIQNEPSVVVWGSGTPRREALYIDDLADACIFLMNNYDDPEMINIGSGADISIGELAQSIRAVTGFKGSLVLDKSKPDGMPRKLLDTTKLSKMGWSPKTSLDTGLEQTYQWYRENCTGKDTGGN